MKKIILITLLTFMTIFPIQSLASANLIEPKLKWEDNKQDIDISNIGKLQLEANQTFLDSENSVKLNEFADNTVDEKYIIGSVFPTNDEDWQVTVEYYPVGLINTNKSLHPEKNLNTISKHYSKDGSPYSNITWAKEPSYSEKNNTLTQSLVFTHNERQVVNHQSFTLTKGGYVLLTTIHNQKKDYSKVGQTLLDNLSINKNEKYISNSISTKQDLNSLSTNGIKDNSIILEFIFQNIFITTVGSLFVLVFVIFYIATRKKMR